MQILFRKRLRMNKFSYINLFKHSTGIAFGLPFFRIGFNSRKGLYLSGSIPKTGLYAIHYVKVGRLIFLILLLLTIYLLYSSSI